MTFTLNSPQVNLIGSNDYVFTVNFGQGDAELFTTSTFTKTYAMAGEFTVTAKANDVYNIASVSNIFMDYNFLFY